MFKYVNADINVKKHFTVAYTLENMDASSSSSNSSVEEDHSYNTRVNTGYDTSYNSMPLTSELLDPYLLGSRHVGSGRSGLSEENARLLTGSLLYETPPVRETDLHETMGTDIREFTFQHVIDTILKPAGVKVGGYPEEIFQDLEEDEKEKWICNICFLLAKECRECDNKHLFCETCIFAWSLTYGENSRKCPMCRIDQKQYNKCKELNRKILDKKVLCNEGTCTFKSPLRIYLLHSHGRSKYSNGNIDLESLRPADPIGSRLIIIPQLTVGDIAGAGMRVRNLRDQLTQGRMMIHQMMLLLQLEMQLRQQALVSYSAARDPYTRLARLDEVLALNEQLNEVGTILHTLLSVPVSGNAAPADSDTVTDRARSAARSVNSALSASTNFLNTNLMSPTMGPQTPRSPYVNRRDNVEEGDEEEDDNDDEDDEDDSSDSSRRTSQYDSYVTRRNPYSRNRTNVSTDTMERPRRRSEIMQSLLGISVPTPRGHTTTQPVAQSDPDGTPSSSHTTVASSGSEANVDVRVINPSELPSSQIRLQQRVLLNRQQTSTNNLSRNGGRSSVTIERTGSHTESSSDSGRTTSTTTLPRIGNASLTSNNSSPSESDGTGDSSNPNIPRGSQTLRQTMRSLQSDGSTSLSSGSNTERDSNRLSSARTGTPSRVNTSRLESIASSDQPIQTRANSVARSRSQTTSQSLSNDTSQTDTGSFTVSHSGGRASTQTSSRTQAPSTSNSVIEDAGSSSVTHSQSRPITGTRNRTQTQSLGRGTQDDPGSFTVSHSEGRPASVRPRTQTGADTSRQEDPGTFTVVTSQASSQPRAGSGSSNQTQKSSNENAAQSRNQGASASISTASRDTRDGDPTERESCVSVTQFPPLENVEPEQVRRPSLTGSQASNLPTQRRMYAPQQRFRSSSIATQSSPNSTRTSQQKSSTVQKENKTNTRRNSQDTTKNIRKNSVSKPIGSQKQKEKKTTNGSGPSHKEPTPRKSTNSKVSTSTQSLTRQSSENSTSFRPRRRSEIKDSLHLNRP